MSALYAELTETYNPLVDFAALLSLGLHYLYSHPNSLSSYSLMVRAENQEISSL